MKLADLRKLIPIYKPRSPANEYVLADQIINLELQIIAAKSKHLAPDQPAPQQLAPHPSAQQPLQSNEMHEILTNCPQQIPNLYWQPGHPIGAPGRTFRQIKYLPLSNAVPDLDQPRSGARIDCGRDLHQQLIKYIKAAKVWMTIQVEYELANPLANKLLFEQYLSAALTRVFQRNGTISAFANPYIDSLQIFTDQIREFNAKFIRDKSNLRLARVLQLTLKMAKYAPLEGRGWQFLQEFLTKKKAIINIQNNDERCFGYALFYFFKRENFLKQNCFRTTLYNDIMFQVTISTHFLIKSHSTMLIFTRIWYR